jgi:hypothetical protein
VERTRSALSRQEHATLEAAVDTLARLTCGANCNIGRCRDFPSRRDDKKGGEERVSPVKHW